MQCADAPGGHRLVAGAAEEPPLVDLGEIREQLGGDFAVPGQAVVEAAQQGFVAEMRTRVGLHVVSPTRGRASGASSQESHGPADQSQRLPVVGAGRVAATLLGMPSIVGARANMNEWSDAVGRAT